jgi:hypothetical protein
MNYNAIKYAPYEYALGIEWFTCRLRKTVRKPKHTAIVEKPNIRSGLLPIRSMTRPWGEAGVITLASVFFLLWLIKTSGFLLSTLLAELLA